jgi:hypothetical protein
MNEGTSGGFKEVILEEDVYGTLKFEAGVHRGTQYHKQKLRVVCTLQQQPLWYYQKQKNLMFKLI